MWSGLRMPYAAAANREPEGAMMKKTVPDKIILNNMIFHGHVGVLPEEKQNGQRFEIDIVISSRRLPACESDLLSQTIDYSLVYSQTKQIVEEAGYDLIEKLAATIADNILRKHRLADGVEVTIRKPEAPIEGRFAYMGVTIYRERS